MLRDCIQFVLCFFVVLNDFCEGQFVEFKNNYDESTTSPPPLPFPPCRADNIDCLRRGLRTFFFLMDSGYMGMTPIDPLIINSVALTLPEQQLSILMRRVNVTGAKWTKLAERKFHLMDDKSGVKFITDQHINAEITMNMPAIRVEPVVAFVTIDIQEIESNITYPWSGRQGVDNEDYIVIGKERIAVRNTRAPTFFVQPKYAYSNLKEMAKIDLSTKIHQLSYATYYEKKNFISSLPSILRFPQLHAQMVTFGTHYTIINMNQTLKRTKTRKFNKFKRMPNEWRQETLLELMTQGCVVDNEETQMIEHILKNQPSILEHFTNEITATLMHSVIDNFRLFARRTPVKYYYEYVN